MMRRGAASAGLAAPVGCAGADPTQLAAFREAGAAVPPTLPRLAEELADARLIVHLGSDTAPARSLRACRSWFSRRYRKGVEAGPGSCRGGQAAQGLDPRPATEMVIELAEDEALAARAAGVGLASSDAAGGPARRVPGECHNCWCPPSPEIAAPLVCVSRSIRSRPCAGRRGGDRSRPGSGKVSRWFAARRVSGRVPADRPARLALRRSCRVGRARRRHRSTP